MNMFRIILCGLFAVAMAMPAAAQIDAAPKVRARLIAEQGEIAPGGTVTIALEEDIRDGLAHLLAQSGRGGCAERYRLDAAAGLDGGADPVAVPQAAARRPVDELRL